MLDIAIDSIEDNITREALQSLIEALRDNPFIRSRGQLLSYTATAAVTNQKIAHQLPFKPKHAVLLSRTGSATVTFNNDNFTSSAIDVTTSAATTFNAWIGTISEDL
jgi:hypothetical protein